MHPHIFIIDDFLSAPIKNYTDFIEDKEHPIVKFFDSRRISEHELKQPSNDSRLGQLKKDLSFAIDEEDYEEAANIEQFEVTLEYQIFDTNTTT